MGGNLYLSGGSGPGGGNVFIYGGRDGGGAGSGNVVINHNGGNYGAGGNYVWGDTYLNQYDTSYNGATYVTNLTSGAAVFTVEGSMYDGAPIIFKNSNSQTAGGATNHRRVLDLKAETGYSNLTDFIRFYVAGVGDGYISNSSGTLGFVQESDEDLKKDIALNETDFLDVINNIEIVDFSWKDDEKAMMFPRQTGIIAQQAASVFGKMISFRDHLGIMYETLHPHYIKAIQQLTQKNSDLEERIQKLENIINNLNLQ